MFTLFYIVKDCEMVIMWFFFFFQDLPDPLTKIFDFSPSHPILDTGISIYPPPSVPHAHRTPPLVLKRRGLESYGRRLISLNSKTNRITFFSPEKRKKKSLNFFWFFQIFLLLIYSDFLRFWIYCWILLNIY